MKRRKKITFILGVVFFALVIVATVFSLSLTASLLDVRAAQLEDAPGESWEDDFGENLGEGLSEAFLIVFLLICAIFGGIASVLSLIFSAFTIKETPFAVRLLAVIFTVASGATLLWFTLGTFLLVKG